MTVIETNETLTYSFTRNVSDEGLWVTVSIGSDGDPPNINYAVVRDAIESALVDVAISSGSPDIEIHPSRSFNGGEALPTLYPVAP